jgi:hypothetical protein
MKIKEKMKEVESSKRRGKFRFYVDTTRGYVEGEM